MKKTTIFGILCMICTLSFGQILNAPKLNQQHRIASMKSSFQNQASIAANPSKLPLSIVAALFSENFEGVTAPALPSGWTTTGNAGSDKFKTGTNTTAGSTYFPVTAHTKFVFSNDDNCNCDKSNDILNFPTLDFTGKTGLTLRFESYMSIPPYLDNDSAFVEISTDGGTTYTIIYRLPKTNSWTVNSVDLNAYNNLPDVRLRFRYIDDVEATATWAYGVAIDDIVVDLPPNNDLFISKTYFGTDPANNTIPDSTLSSYYSSIPSCQSNADTLTFWATATNSGAVSQPNVILDINVTGAGTFSGSSAATSVLAPGNSVDLMSTTDFTPQAIGTYDINFTVSSDSIEATPTNNTIIRSFNVTDTVYARDDDNFSSGTLYDNFGTMYILGNLFEVNVQDTATSISMYVGAYGNPIYNPTGKSISLDLYDMGVDPAVVLAQEFYSITAGDLGTWITRPLPGGVSLPPGIYLAAYQMYTDTFLIVKSDLEAPPLTSLYSTDNAATWSYVPYVPFVRLNLKGCTPSCLMTASGTSTDALCGGNNGTATVTAANGSGTYTYSWSPSGQTSATATGLSAGTHSVTVDDGTGCSATASVTVTSSSSGLAISNVTAGDDTCGSGTGTATVTLGGGVSPFIYTWSPSVGTGATVTGLTAGTYNVTVTDAPGCTATNSVTVNMITTNLAIDTITSVDASSCVAADGSASATVTGGQAPFVYSWSNGQTTTTATGLVSAPYGFMVTDKYGCSDSSAVVVNAVGAPQVSATITGTIACNGDNTGSADATVIGGTLPYTYAWSTTPTQTGSTATGLTADLYIISVSDAGGCNAYAQVTITEPAALSTINGSTDITCNGLNDGTAGVVVSGGTGAYTYSWNTTPPQTGPDATGLAAGSYKVVFNDANSCTDSVSFTITEPTALTAAASATDVLCNGNSTGSATATVSGGVSPYAYSWTGGQTTSAATGLTAGAYTVAVTDANGCTANSSATITEPTALTVVEDTTTTTARIYITVSGGVSPYGFIWSNGSTAEDPLITGPGTYTVTVTDVNACTKTLTVSITGITENNVNISFTLNPNPAKEMFILTMKNMKKDTYAFELRNILGQAILSESVEISGNFTRKFNVSKLNKGVYFLKVKNSQGERTEKVVKY